MNKELLKKDIHNFLIPIVISLLFIYICNYNLISLCPIQFLFSKPCPFCGITRASIFLLQGEFLKAFQMNACIYLLVIFSLYFFYQRYIKENNKNIIIGLIVVLLLFILYYIIGMLNYYPNIEPFVLH